VVTKYPQAIAPLSGHLGCAIKIPCCPMPFSIKISAYSFYPKISY
jgi:hypothetical protein